MGQDSEGPNELRAQFLGGTGQLQIPGRHPNLVSWLEIQVPLLLSIIDGLVIQLRLGHGIL